MVHVVADVVGRRWCCWARQVEAIALIEAEKCPTKRPFRKETKCFHLGQHIAATGVISDLV